MLLCNYLLMKLYCFVFYKLLVNHNFLLHLQNVLIIYILFSLPLVRWWPQILAEYKNCWITLMPGSYSIGQSNAVCVSTTRAWLNYNKDDMIRWPLCSKNFTIYLTKLPWEIVWSFEKDLRISSRYLYSKIRWCAVSSSRPQLLHRGSPVNVRIRCIYVFSGGTVSYRCLSSSLYWPIWWEKVRSNLL